MNDDKIAFSCPNCDTRLKGPATGQKVRCVKYQKIADRTLSSMGASLPKSPPGLPSQTKTASPRPVGWVGLPKSLRFFSYCWRFYAATHTSLPWFFRMMFGNVFIPAWSFSKPRIAIQSLLGGFVLTAMLASSPVIAQVDDEAQKTVGSDSPEIAKPINSNSTVKNQVVIAEGVGATAEDAIKDAFRHAVRQVVGAVVDAETLIENDEIIEDKVLTYSDGFIKSYEEVVGSKKVKDGLHRIKIKAQVERGGVIAKLNAANVSVKEIDGKGLFAEAVTQLDAEKDAAALLQKQFEGFPQSCIAATIIGEPEIVEKSTEEVKVKFTVKIEPDLKAYEAFADKLIPVLDKLAKDKGKFTIEYRPHYSRPSGTWRPVDHNIGQNKYRELIPNLFAPNGTWKNNQVSIAVAARRSNANHDRIDYKYYSLDPSLETVLYPVVTMIGECELQLFDAEGEPIATDRFNPMLAYRNCCSLFLALQYPDVRPDGSFGSMHQSVVQLRSKEISVIAGAGPFGRAVERQRNSVQLMFLAPYFNDGFIVPAFTIPRTLTLSLDELKSIKEAKIELTFR